MQSSSCGPQACAAVFLILGLLACNDPPAGPSDTSASLSPTRQWSGGTVTLQGGLVREIQTGFVLTAGTDTLAWTRVDDSTVTAVLPDLTSQTLQITFHSSRYTASIGTVEVAGYGGAGALSEGFYGPVIPWPWRNPTAFLGANDLSSNFARDVSLASPATGLVTAYPSRTAGPYPGWLDYQSGVLLLAASTGGADRWQVPGWTTMGTVAGVSISRQLYELGPNALLLTSNHYAWTVVRADSTQPWQERYNEANESPWKIVFSPRGDRATIVTNANRAGIPVFDLATGDTAYHVTQLQTSWAAEFSPDGGILYLAGTTLTGNSGTVELVAVDATDGTLLQEVPMDRDPAGLLADPSGQRLYVSTTDTLLQLRVLDAHTLATEATIKVPASEVKFPAYPEPWCPMVISAAQHLLYLVPDENPATRVVRFDLVD